MEVLLRVVVICCSSTFWKKPALAPAAPNPILYSLNVQLRRRTLFLLVGTSNLQHPNCAPRPRSRSSQLDSSFHIVTIMSSESSSPPATKRADGKRIREEKQRKWKAKRERRNHQTPAGSGDGDGGGDTVDSSSSSSSANSTSAAKPAAASCLTTHQEDSMNPSRPDEAPSVAPRVDAWISQRDYARRIATADDLSSMPDLESYGNLRDAQLVARQGVFVAEGTETVRLLLRDVERMCSNWLSGDRKSLMEDEVIRVMSIVCKPSVLMDPPVRLVDDVEAAMQALVVCNGARENDDELPQWLPAFRVFVADEKVQNQLTGYGGARGAMACGCIPTNRDEAWLVNGYLRHLNKDRLRLLAVDGVSDTANLGSMIRSASAFGVDAIVLSHTTCDAWYRRCIRVSMGHVFRVPTVRVKELASVLRLLRERYQVVSYAAVLKDCDLVLEQVQKGTFS
jgi:SpoU rRNA Methylase family